LFNLLVSIAATLNGPIDTLEVVFAAKGTGVGSFYQLFCKFINKNGFNGQK